MIPVSSQKSSHWPWWPISLIIPALRRRGKGISVNLMQAKVLGQDLSKTRGWGSLGVFKVKRRVCPQIEDTVGLKDNKVYITLFYKVVSLSYTNLTLPTNILV